MTNKQENKNSMYQAVIRKCQKFESLWIDIPAFEPALNEFKAAFTAIQTANEHQMVRITGIAEAKQKEEDEMIAKTLELSSAVFAYASITNNFELKRMVDFSPSSLKRMSDTELKSMCKLVSKAAISVAKALENYGISATDIEDLDKEIMDYENMIAEPREAVTTRAKATAQLAELFPIADTILKEQLDKLMMIFKAKHPDFYTEYFNSRKIIDLGVRHQSSDTEA